MNDGTHITNYVVRAGSISQLKKMAVGNCQKTDGLWDTNMQAGNQIQDVHLKITSHDILS